MFERKYILGERRIVRVIRNPKGKNNRVRNPKSKNDFVGVWAREEHFFALKKIFSRNPTPHFINYYVRKIHKKYCQIF